MALINNDGFFDIDLSVQLLPKDIEKLFNEGGWSTLAKFRAVRPKSGDSYRKKFAETYLFESRGSDSQTRFFGLTTAWGGKVTPVGEEPVISKDTELGILEDSGDGLTFKFKVFPVFAYSVVVYNEDGTVLSPTTNAYTIDEEGGTITFTSAPTGKIRATYALTDNAPELVKRMWFFTFEGFLPTRFVSRTNNVGEPELLLDGTVYKFQGLRSNEKVRQGTVKVYDSASASAVVYTEGNDFTVDYDAGTVTFITTAPATPLAEYEIELIPVEGKDYGDVYVHEDFEPTNPATLMGGVYNAVRFIYPSLPTAVSLIPDEELTLGWGRDSQVYFWGNINKDRIVAYFRLDPAPDPELTYFAPLYIGRLSTIGKSPRLNNVLIGGCRTEDEVKYTTGIKLGRNIVDYGANTSNGNSSVSVQRSIGGAMYQKHFLAFITHDAEVDPSNESRFNPSVYSGKYHISPMYIVHPSDGYVGRLDEVYAIHPKNIAQLDELEVREHSDNEHVGTGDGEQDTFHFFHLPVVDPDFELRLVDPAGGCTTLTSTNQATDVAAMTSGQFFIEKETKKLVFADAPAVGVEVVANYNYNQTYRYTLADTPITPFQLANMSPYTPIGLGFLKENI